ncbi:MAG: hypothetical protein ACNA8W_13165, partial [Bradymonadaceae bacterium]
MSCQSALKWIFLGLMIGLIGCGDDANRNRDDTPQCPPGEVLNPISGECAPTRTDNNNRPANNETPPPTNNETPPPTNNETPPPTNNE